MMWRAGAWATWLALPLIAMSQTETKSREALQKELKQELGEASRQPSDCPDRNHSDLQASGRVQASDFVELERMAAGWGGGGATYRVRLFGNGDVVWRGENGVVKRGYPEAKISAQQAADLITSFESAGFYRLCGKYTNGYSDARGAATTLSVGGHVKRVSDNGASAPMALQNLDKRLDALVGTDRRLRERATTGPVE